MSDFFEIDFLAVESKKSGDAITAYYSIDGDERVHVIDGGYTATGRAILEHLEYFYDRKVIDVVTVTHSDQDHTLGLKTVLTEGNVGALVMNRPWEHAEDLLAYFPTYKSIDALRSKLRSVYDYIADLEDIATERGIPIYDAFQGFQIYGFRVMSPTKDHYLRLIAESTRTPESNIKSEANKLYEALARLLKAAANLVSSAWNNENFPTSATNRENEMSVVQYAEIAGQRILLTGDAGREALQATIDYAPLAGLYLPGVDKFQVPHHGSRRNLSTSILNDILGPQIAREDYSGNRFSSFVSSAAEDEHHPKNAVLRAMHHRDGTVMCTEGQSIYWRFNRPMRSGWGPVPRVPYPETQEE